MSSLHAFFRNRFLTAGTLIAAAANASLWLYLSRHAVRQGETVPIHYNIYFGIDLVGPWWYLYLIPLLAAGVLIVNAFLSVILHEREKLLAYFLTSASALVQLLFFLAGYLAVTQI